MPNKTTADLKAMFLNALDKAGGDKYVLEQFKANPVSFMTLLGKVLTMQVNGSANVLLIAQLCVIANQEWQVERKKLSDQSRTIDSEAAEVAKRASLENRRFIEFAGSRRFEDCSPGLRRRI